MCIKTRMYMYMYMYCTYLLSDLLSIAGIQPDHRTSSEAEVPSLPAGPSRQLGGL